MLRLFHSSIVFALSPLFCAACGDERRAVRILTEKDDGGDVVLSPGDMLEVVLAGNPTAGYEWDVVAYDVSLLEVAEQAAYQGGATDVGTGGTFRFFFTALKPGQTPLRLAYRRPFEKGVKARRTYGVSVVVKAG